MYEYVNQTFIFMNMIKILWNDSEREWIEPVDLDLSVT